MHRTLPRCYLNSMECSDQVTTGRLGVDSSYTFLVQRTTPEEDAAAQRRLQVEDAGFSSASLLRFHPVQFASGGRFKVCFCDAATRTSASACAVQSDYNIEVGQVVVTGVSCLLKDPKYRRTTCLEQFHGGLRCKDGLTPVLVTSLPGQGVHALPSKWVLQTEELQAAG